jgi:hypothetical protein
LKVNKKTIDRLVLFNETVYQLQGYSFWKSFPQKSGINIIWDNSIEGVKIKSQVFGPSDESISAFLLKYRLFIQDKDDISLRNLEMLYSSILIDNSYKDKYKNLRKSINNVLDQPSNVQIKKHRVTIREIHDMFIYGSYAHMDEKDLNRKRFVAIKDNTVLFSIFANDFNVTLIKIMNELVQIKLLNEKVIKILTI